MAEIIRMPEVLAGTAEAAVQTWNVGMGDVLAQGAKLAEIETEKAVVEYIAETSGTVGRLLVAEGQNVAVGEPIVVLVAEGEGDAEIDAALAAAGVTVSPAPGAAATASPTAPEVPAPAPVSVVAPVRRFISPLVRRLAQESDVDLGSLTGSGPHGRIVRRDLEKYLELRAAEMSRSAQEAATPSPAAPIDAVLSASDDNVGYVDVPLDRMRKAIANRLTLSKSTVPHFYLTADCRVDELLALRARVNETAVRRVSVNDFVLKAAAAALVEVPEANSIWNTDSIRRFDRVDIAVAVAVDGGLTTPVLRDVARTPLSEVSASVADLAERARAGKLRQHELEGGSFAVSNLGMYGTASFSAILNPPQAGILAVGAAQKRPVVDAEDVLSVATVMTVTLSADHRVLDGAVAAQWLAAFQRRIENPLSILI
ncbi:pyruvate dehydrogenase E2 component (dihydrolipoamide acetyltransferase) [Agreia bicolorata]|uniref:Dihydrolipoamide acetyltransferase component of pyruvate dehydrogenase complex n=1 Tax=Agreia bicolorata TaxID=110935 RepID=A0A1T4WX19_9MICO|nr:dihydrolipoamide acetyltransferase family protein [Agreia bicolorata]SKA81779.1 pyruvate dehydrogenase E2 component (dihydrolipoamide acetyltransferase) [Agreia bicolorata]